MIIPRIKIKRRISADTQNTVVSYVLEVFIDSIVAYNTDTRQEEGPYEALPLEMFLYRKYNNRTDGDPVMEPVSAGSFVRFLEPADLDALNPVLFSSEKLRWAGTDNARSSELYSTLMPSVSASGAELTLNSISGACAPTDTGNFSAYYKSRAYIKRSTDYNVILSARDNIDNMIAIFKLKYAEESEYITEGTGAVETETYEV